MSSSRSISTTTRPDDSNVSSANLRTTPSHFSLPRLAEFDSVFYKSAVHRQRLLYFTVMEWLGDAALDFALFYYYNKMKLASDALDDKDSQKSRSLFHEYFKTAHGQKTLCGFCSIRGQRITLEGLIKGIIRELHEKGYSDWLEFYIGVLFVEHREIFSSVMEGLVSFATKNWEPEWIRNDLSQNKKSDSTTSTVPIRSTLSNRSSSSLLSKAVSTATSNTQSSPSTSSSKPHPESKEESQEGSKTLQLPQSKRKPRPQRPWRAQIAHSSVSFAYTSILCNELISSLAVDLDRLKGCKNILMHLLNEGRQKMNQEYPDIPLEAWPHSRATIRRHLFENRIFQFLITPTFNIHQLCNKLRSLPCIRDLLSDFRRQVTSVIALHYDGYTFTKGPTQNDDWRISLDNIDTIFKGSSHKLTEFLLNYSLRKRKVTTNQRGSAKRGRTR